MKINKIPLDLCYELFYYNDNNGILYWKILHSRYCNTFKVGDVVGSVSREGYIVTKIKGKHAQVHRVLYQLYYNIQLENEYIDHIDGNQSNNKKDNLRLCTNGENQCNRGVQKNNKSTGVKNIRIYTNKSGNEYWILSVRKNRVDNRTVYRKDKYTLEDIIKIRDKLLEELHKDFKNLG